MQANEAVSSTTDSMRALFEPRSIAIVGASDDPSRIGGRPQRILQERGFAGQIYPVNPKYETIQGLTAYKSLTDIDAPIDLVIISIPANATVAALEEAGRAGARAVVMFTGGFAETGDDGARMQRQLGEIAAKYGIALLGPNSLGHASFATNTYGTFATTLETMPAIEPGRVAFVSQSGGTAFNVFTEAYQVGARFSHIIATGNEAGLKFTDYLQYLVADESTDAVIAYLEGIHDGAAFIAALENLRSAGKPVFILKSGSSDRGQRSVASHTAQFAGSDIAIDGVFGRYGVVRLYTMDELVDVARTLSTGRGGSGLAVATNSGGATSYISDLSERYGAPLADLGQQTDTALRDVLPPFAGFENPVDFTPQVISDDKMLGETLRILDRDPAVDQILIFLGSMEYMSEKLIGMVEEVRPELESPVILTWLGVSDAVRMRVAASGLPVAGDPARALRGIGLVRRAEQAIVDVSTPEADAPDIARTTDDTIALDITYPPAPWDESAAMRVLADFDLPVPDHCEVTSLEELRVAAASVGFPSVMKILEPFIPHRMKVGGVKVGIDSLEELEVRYQTMVDELGMTRALLTSHAETGPELIVGVLTDETFGTRAVVGAGGIWTNDVEDTRPLVPPYDTAYVAAEIAKLRIANQIKAAHSDLDMIAAEIANMLRIMAKIVTSTDIAEIECNPIRVTTTGVTILDALALGERA